MLKSKSSNTNIGDEGISPSLKSNQQAVELILAPSPKQATSQGRMYTWPSMPQPELFENGSYKLAREGALSPEQMVQFYADWVRQYPIISIEDGLAEDDWGVAMLISRSATGSK